MLFSVLFMGEDAFFIEPLKRNETGPEKTAGIDGKFLFVNIDCFACVGYKDAL